MLTDLPTRPPPFCGLAVLGLRGHWQRVSAQRPAERPSYQLCPLVGLTHSLGDYLNAKEDWLLTLLRHLPQHMNPRNLPDQSTSREPVPAPRDKRGNEGGQGP